VRRAIVESQRRKGDTDYDAGLDELIEHGWAESKTDRSAFRLTPKGRYLRDRALPKPDEVTGSGSCT
jgi:DNA-binding PadR family transcriptional regulator